VISQGFPRREVVSVLRAETDRRGSVIGGVIRTWHLSRHLGKGLFAALAELGVARMTPPRDPEDAAARLSAALRAVGDAHDLVVRVSGELPREPSLLVANHVSYLDPLAILSVIPAVPLAKADVAAWPVVGGIARALGVNFVDRHRPWSRIRALRRVHATLAAGTSVLTFPEGTTTDGTRVLPFQRGCFGIAARLDRPIVPIAIRYDDRRLAWTGQADFLPHYLATARRDRCDVHLVVAPTIYPRAGEAPERLAARARAAIARTLERIGVLHARARLRVPAPRPDPVLPLADG
jgi:1-acyl-sn-glycerol-3-phosphate acyltransferase